MKIISKKAINLNVIDYILKPITHDNIVKVLEKTKELLDREHEEKMDVTRLKEYFEKSYPLLRNQILHLFVSGIYSGDVAESRMDYYNIKIPGGPYRVGIIQIKSDIDTVKTQTYETNKIMLYEVANKIIEDRKFGTAYIFDEYIVWLFAYENTEDKNDKKLESTVNEIEQYVDKFMSFNIKVSIGQKYEDKNKRSLSYKEAKSALDYANDKPENEIIFIWDVEPDDKRAYLNIRKNETTRAIKTGSIEDCLQIIDAIFDDIERNDIKEKDYKLYLLEYTFNIIKNANLLDANVGEDYAEGKIIDFLKESSSLPQLKGWVINLVENVVDEIVKQRDDKNINYTQKAVKYILTHYNDPDLNINKLCQALYISPTYFCSIFKKNTDSTFNKYLTDIRLEKAKKLIESTDKKNFEIADMTGFSDANYFSYCFKKNVGLSPSQYRESAKEL